MFRRVLRKLQLLIRRGQFHRELGEEMAFHREQVEEELRAGGMSAEQVMVRPGGNSATICSYRSKAGTW